jgi:GntR family transcriptional repressor for pyruvate dehydrogenase complex
MKHQAAKTATAETSALAGKPGAEGLVGRTVRAIVDDIRANGLRKNDLLPAENALAAKLGVSRIVVREAHHYLAALGIVEIANGRAPRVSVPDENVIGMMFDHVVYTRHVTVQQVLAVRRPLEIRAAALAAMRRTPEQAEQMVTHAAAMRASLSDPDVMRQHDMALHELIADASQNPLLAIMIKAFAPVTRQTWPVGWKSRSEPREQSAMVACHEAIADAILQQDVSRAHEAMSQHFDDTVRALVSAGVT